MAKIEVKRPVLRYHGGKFLLAPWITDNLPQHRIYVEPFGGAASVLMQKSRSYSEVYNDKWDTVVNVFEVLRDPDSARELERRIRLTPFARSEFNKCGDAHIRSLEDPIERARLTILRSFAGFGSAATNAEHSTGFRSNANKNGTTPANDWLSYPNHISSFVARLQGVVIENRSYEQVIAQHDTPETLFFLDPPYVHATRNMRRGNAAYAHEMDDMDHAKMADIVHNVKGMVVLSGYKSSLYDRLFPKWAKVEKETFGDGATRRVECLYLNNLAVLCSQKRLLF